MTFSVNVKGVFLGCKHGIPALRRSEGGSIINTASFVAKVGAATAQLAYTSSKGAVLSMTRELAVVHGRENIRINALCPSTPNSSCSTWTPTKSDSAAWCTFPWALRGSRRDRSGRAVAGLRRVLVRHRRRVWWTEASLPHM